MRIQTLALAAAALLASGCSREPAPAPAGTQANAWLTQALQSPAYRKACADTPGCTTVEQAPPGPTEGVWRVRVVRAASGKLSIAEVDRLEVPAGDGVPVGAQFGQAALVGLDGSGAVVDGQPLRFPETLRLEFEGVDTAEQIDLAKQNVDTFAYLRAKPEMVSLAIRDLDGKDTDKRDLPAPPATAWLDRLTGWLGITAAHAVTRPFQGLPPWCSHIIVLQGEADRRLAEGIEFASTVELVEPGPYQLAATEAALARHAPLLCQSISRIAYGKVPNRPTILGAVKSGGAGDLMLINVDSLVSEEDLEEKVSRRLKLQGTISHESGHAAETLLTFEGSSDTDVKKSYRGSWSFPARTLADKTIDNVRLEMGLHVEWLRMHESFVDHDWAADYGAFPLPKEGEPPQTWTPDDVVKGGFMSQYSSTNWAEDIADFVGWAYLSRPVTDAYAANNVSDSLREDFGCLVMRKYAQRNLPAQFADAYTKLHFLQDLGLVRPADVKDCMGSDLGLPIDGPGFHVWQGTMELRSFQNQLEAGIGTRQNGVPVFNMSATGEANFMDKAYPAEVRLGLDLGNRFQDFEMVSWPRGVYELGLTGNNNFTLRLDGAKAGNFDAMDGFALVAESSAKRIAGSVVLQRVFRLNAPLPVPERYDPPLVVRFLIEK